MEIREKPSLWLSSGAYEIQSWDPQKKIELKPNPRFWKKGPRPNLEVLMINEDSVALSLYEKGELSLLRRLPSLFIPKYKDRPDFFEVEQIRFDYFGFSPKWKEMPEIRRAISRAIPYSEWQKLYQSKGLPGCAGLPSHLMTESVCLTFDPVEAQAEWQPLRNRPKKFEVLYSKQGGDDHKRTMEWLQAEILKNLNFTLEVNGIENHIFLQRLEKNPPDMFRKGVAPERPTCVSALENFETGNSENYIQFSDPRFDQLLKQMRETASLSQKQKLCTQALHLLVDPAWVIPTGPIHFTLLASPQWMGWKLNELNQLDLSELRLKTSVDAKPKQR
jgi:oligopeptide transport system substrate-binding protein